MPPLAGFSDNPLRTRDDLLKATYALLTPLTSYQSPKGARIRIPVGTAAHFDETAAQLEGFARPLWAIGALLASHDPNEPIDDRLQGWIEGLASGTDPTSGVDEYWGEVADLDQRMVEIEILGYALLAAPYAFLGPKGSKSENDVKRLENIKRLLNSVNGREFPQNNWLWFRVMANLALVKSCGVPYENLKTSMDADLKVLDSFYFADGWASDGLWSEKKGTDRKQMDYYSGSYAIQFSQCVYVKYAADLDPGRVEVFRQRAREYAVDFWRYFDEDGASIPFGRSLTYRFAMGAFWAAVTMAEIDLPDPLTPGVVKGLLLRHLRYWAKKPDIFYPDGTLNIGFAYPNMFMCEDYNSPQSPYWCMKTFVMLALPKDHAFWSFQEEPLPLSTSTAAEDLRVKLLKHPKHILVDSGNHHFLLSSGQYCGWPLKASQAKYCKFAYSSTFGFSVPTGSLIQQMAPDSTLALSIDDGETWRVRWRSEETTFGHVTFKNKLDDLGTEVPTLVNVWMPTKSSELKVPGEATYGVSAVEGGYAIYGQKAEDGRPLKPLNWTPPSATADKSQSEEGVLEEYSSSLVVSSAGASGIHHILGPNTRRAKGVVLKPDSNTNLMVSRTLIPTIQQKLLENEGQAHGSEIILITAVFAVTRSHLSASEIRKRWFDVPRVKLNSSKDLFQEEFIQIDGI
ncbi:hypothetical protein L207DRAFT_550802 [Hyaloscypha variabilis F]|uniref:Uncharacterized protein n=1 Tax=Hyaloscypha variabilis (strain UAMH 11265 / GT02V1 / F) TaxID=1149755 RepID=A0A2J6S884_HYAVF|nr:hypothetical protein L207DRAFT_550802 [Hyaloscypha variabilis F]